MQFFQTAGSEEGVSGSLTHFPLYGWKLFALFMP